MARCAIDSTCGGSHRVIMSDGYAYDPRLARYDAARGDLTAAELEAYIAEGMRRIEEAHKPEPASV